MKCSAKSLLYIVLKSVLIPLIAALVMAFVWDLLDWMQTYGSGLPLIPQLKNLPEHMFTADIVHYSPVDSFISWYNVTFLGAARFGTALGIVLGGIYVICSLERHSLTEKYVAMIIIGLIIGGRIGLLISSSAHIFIAGLIVGAIMGAWSTFAFRYADQVPNIPLTSFGQ